MSPKRKNPTPSTPDNKLPAKKKKAANTPPKLVKQATARARIEDVVWEADKLKDKYGERSYAQLSFYPSMNALASPILNALARWSKNGVLAPVEGRQWKHLSHGGCKEVVNGASKYGYKIDIRVLHSEYGGILDDFKKDFEKITSCKLEVSTVLVAF